MICPCIIKQIEIGKMKLQGIHGEQKTVSASELKVGDVTTWNYGYTETITAIRKTKSGKSLIFDIVCNNSGYQGNRTMRANSQVVRAN